MFGAFAALQISSVILSVMIWVCKRTDVDYHDKRHFTSEDTVSYPMYHPYTIHQVSGNTHTAPIQIQYM